MLDGAGAELWRRVLALKRTAFGIQVIPTQSGDVVVWTTSGLTWLGGDSVRVALHDSEDVLVAGQRRGGFWVARLARRTGRPRWQRTLGKGGPRGVSTGFAVRSAPSGLIVAGGSFKLPSPDPNARTAFGVVLLCEADGGLARRCR